MGKKYYKEMDVIKGVAILFVILGHSFCSYPFPLVDNFSTDFIACVKIFQMPLFFMVSGFLFRIERYSMTDFLRNKIHRLFIPWLIFAIATVSLRFTFSSITRTGNITLLDSLINVLNGHYYWFLYVLFFMMLLVKILHHKPLLYTMSLLFVLLCSFGVCTSSICSLNRFAPMFPFFILGIFLQDYYEKIASVGYFKILLMGLVLFVSYVLTASMNDYVYLLQGLITPIMGAFAACMFGIVLLKSSVLTFVFSHFGKYSLQYYLNHLLIMLPIYYLVEAFHCSYPPISLFLIFIGGVFMSYFMLLIEKRNVVLRKICGLA